MFLFQVNVSSKLIQCNLGYVPNLDLFVYGSSHLKYLQIICRLAARERVNLGSLQ